MKTKIQIKQIYSNIKVLFEFEKENNTIKDTVEEAVKQNVNLSGANLCGADLRFADLHKANLNEANLGEADLHGANLSDAILRYTNLWGANLSYADLYGACLYCANLSCADLYGADLSETNLNGANLRGARHIPYIPLNCPSEGSFIAWKKVGGKLVQLEIPEDAKRSSATSMKCRCSKARVLSITDLNGSHPINEILNTSQGHVLLYMVGKVAYPDRFDSDRWNECSHGIHFFINKQDAINY
jgi:uncharacterized protein YjbI with pentapeptide repeats